MYYSSYTSHDICTSELKQSMMFNLQMKTTYKCGKRNNITQGKHLSMCYFG